MASDADPYAHAVSLMEDALEMLDALGASEAAALLDHAIYEVPTAADFVRKRRASNLRIGFDVPDEIDEAEAS